MQRTSALFDGLQRAYGQFLINRINPVKKKAEGVASTVRSTVTAELWAAHLSGERGLGIAPLRDDGTVRFGAIDIDVPTINHAALEEATKELGLPLIVCRSKSGGAHCYLFLREPLSAKKARGYLFEWASALGHPGVEIFPKQEGLASTRDVGNWLNMPYFDYEGPTTRYAVIGGVAASLEAFLDYAEALTMTGEDLAKIHVVTVQDMDDGPPCLQFLAKRGEFPQGSRNNALFNCAVYARKRYGDMEWEVYVDRFNETYCNPRLSSGEIQSVVKSARKKSYGYLCSQPPINEHCNRPLCRSRRFGVGLGENDDSPINVMLDDLTRVETQPPTWFMSIDGRRVELTTEQLKNVEAFRTACMDQVGKLPPPMTRRRWEKALTLLMENMTIVNDVPSDAGARGQFFALLEDFLTLRAPARSKDELLQGKHWLDEDGRVYFRSRDLMVFLDRERMKMSTREVYSALRTHSHVAHHSMMLKGRCISAWSIPRISNAQTDEFDVSIPEGDF